jgi:hypothetical protein
MNFFKKLISWFIYKIINRCLAESISFSHLYKKKILDFIFEKQFKDRAVYVPNKTEYYKLCCDYLMKHNNRLNLEFGVGGGETGRVLSNNLKNDKIYGFDSFNGFKNDLTSNDFWHSFNLRFKNRKIPNMPLNYIIVNGFIEDTLYDFDKNTFQKLNYDYIFAHIDVDIYEPTKKILSFIKSKKIKSFLMFDEFTNYPEFECHQFRAFYEEIYCDHIEFKIKFFCNSNNQRFGHLTKYFIEIN